MLLVVLCLEAQSGSCAGVLPIISLYALAGCRLMPALQQIYGAVTELRLAGPALDALHADLVSLQDAHPNPSQDTIALKQAITLHQIQYRYPNPHSRH